MAKIKKVDRVSADKLRDSLYSRYESELSNIWQHSIFAWGFQALLFTGYAYLIANFFLERSSSFVSYKYLNTIAVLISFAGLCTSAIWIALVKARRSWQEFFEKLITEFEQNTDYFQFSRIFAMSGFDSRLKDLDSKLYTTNIGKYSPGKLNIFIAQFVWCIWLGIIVYHSLFGDTIASNCLMGTLVFFCYLLFRLILDRNCSNDYLKAEEYKKDYAVDSFLKIQRLERQLNSLNNVKNENSLQTFFLRDLQACKWIIKHYCDYEYEEIIDKFNTDLVNKDFSGVGYSHLKKETEKLIRKVKVRIREEYNGK